MTKRPDWRAVWEDAFVGVRDQLRAERAVGLRRVGLRSTSDSALDRYARREADRRCEQAINRWNEEQAAA